MLKVSYIRKLPNGKYRVFSEKGKNLGTYDSQDEAKKRLKQVEFFKFLGKKKFLHKKATTKAQTPGLTYSGILRSLRKLGDEQLLLDFRKTFKNNFDAVAYKEDDVEDVALNLTLKQLSHKYDLAHIFEEKLDETNIPRFSKVTDSLFRGAAPSPEQVKLLKDKFGVQRIVSLDYKSGLDIAEACKINGIEHIMLPIIISKKEAIKKLLSLDLADLLDSKKTYVHCLHGKDRTGLVVGLLRCQQGETAAAAIDEADQFGFCIGLHPSVRLFFTSLIKACEEKASDKNEVFDIVMNTQWEDDYKINKNYDPSFAAYLFDGIQDPYGGINYYDGQYASRQELNEQEEYKNRKPVPQDRVPQVGLYDNTPRTSGLGPVEVGGGYIT